MFRNKSLQNPKYAFSTQYTFVFYVLRDCDINRKECKRHNRSAMRASPNLCIQQSVAELYFRR